MSLSLAPAAAVSPASAADDAVAVAALTAARSAVATFERAGVKRETVTAPEKYSRYIAAAAAAGAPVTAESMKSHVAAFGETAYPNVKSSAKADHNTDEYRAHVAKCSFRKSLKKYAGIESATKTRAVTLLTPAGRAMEDLETLLALVKDEWIAAQG